MDDALGVGVTYSADLLDLLIDARDLVTVLEVEPQTMWFASHDAEHPYRIDTDALQRMRDLSYTTLMHGIGFPVGGSRPPLEQQYEPLRAMIDTLAVPYMSEHLSFNRAARNGREFNAGFLLPPRQTAAGVAAAVHSIRAMKSRIGIPLAVETGVNYLRPRYDEIRDGQFVARVVNEADCGILLDLHNLLTNERNGRQRVDAFLDELPLDRVWEIHLAGGEERHGFWIDSHCTGMDADLVALAREVIPRCPKLRALIFELFPAYYPQVGRMRMLHELEVMNALWSLRRPDAPVPPHAPVANDASGSPSPAPVEWENALGAIVVGMTPRTSLERTLARDAGTALVRELLNEFRASMIAASLKLTTRLLLLSLGERHVRRIFAEYWGTTRPQLFASDEAEHFADFLLARYAAVEYLTDVVRYERAAIRALIHHEYGVIAWIHDPLPVLRALGEGRLPTSVRIGAYEVEITADDGALPAGLHVQAVAH